MINKSEKRRPSKFKKDINLYENKEKEEKEEKEENKEIIIDENNYFNSIKHKMVVVQSTGMVQMVM